MIRETLFDVEPMKDVDFNMVDFANFKGKVVFAVNVASEDQYTDSVYSFLANLIDKYHDEGFEVLAFPCNWFGQKETGSHEEIKAFVHSKYSDKITVMAKADPEWNEVFALGQAHFPGDIIWNFHGKFLFDRNGKPVERFDLLSEDSYVETTVCRTLAGIPKENISKEAPHPDQANGATADQYVGLQPEMVNDHNANGEDDGEDGEDDEDEEGTDETESLDAEQELAVEAQ